MPHYLFEVRDTDEKTQETIATVAWGISLLVPYRAVRPFKPFKRVLIENNAVAVHG